MKIEVEENKPFVTVRISLPKRRGTGIQSVDINDVLAILKDRGIKVSNIRKSAIIDNYTDGVPSSGEWEFRNSAFPIESIKVAPKKSPISEELLTIPAAPSTEETPTETKPSTPKRRRRNAPKSTRRPTKKD
jgi:hypothetical protein